MRRRLASLSPLAATVLLTAAVFLLPATGERPQARADDIRVSAAHIHYEAAGTPETARK